MKTVRPGVILSSLCLMLSGRWAGAQEGGPEPLSVNEGDLRPGLIARWRSLGGGGETLERIEAKPAFTLGRASIHPRLAPGAFEAAFSGVLSILEEDSFEFGAFLCGELTVRVGGAVVLRARGESGTAWRPSSKPIELPPGFHRIAIEYSSLPGLPSRLQLWWEGKTFRREPLPAWRLLHLEREVPAALREDELRERGRDAAGRFGCARCHPAAFPASDDPAPGPALPGFGDAPSRAWLHRWLESPSTVRPEARMPALFGQDRQGFIERWIVAEHLLRSRPPGEPPEKPPGKLPGKPTAPGPAGDHRIGRRQFISLGCPACHRLPDQDHTGEPDLERTPLSGLGDRLSAERLAGVIDDPHRRYPDGRMPRIPLLVDTARHIASYLLLWSPPGAPATPEPEPPRPEELAAVKRRLGAEGIEGAAIALIREKRCARCHEGLPEPGPVDIPLPAGSGDEGCLGDRSVPRFALDPESRKAIASYRAVALREHHPSPFEAGRRLLRRHGCFRCHARDTVRPSPLETAASTLGGSLLETVPYQRTPSLTHSTLKYTLVHLISAVREGVSGTRPARYSFRMPVFPETAEALVQALGETDGDLLAGGGPAETTRDEPADSTIAGLGPRLVGFEGYSCISCHPWNGKLMAEPDPGAIGPELTRVARRIRREWFDRWLEDPSRIRPGTPMPRIFTRGEPAPVHSILEGDSGRQRDALWAYLALGKDAPAPRALPPIPVKTPGEGSPPLVAQVPVHLPEGGVVEGIAVLFPGHDLLLYDVGRAAPRGFYTGAGLLRSAKGRLRLFTLAGKPVEGLFSPGTAPERGAPVSFEGYDRLPDGVRIRSRAELPTGPAPVAETFRLRVDGRGRRLIREAEGRAVEHGLPPAEPFPPVETARLPDPGPVEGSLWRPGYRAVAYPRPRMASGEDLVLPGALAVSPRDGRVFIASMKMGEIFVLRDPTDDGREARFEDYAGGLFQETFSMVAEGDALHVLHRRNLTRITDTDGDGLADRFDRTAALPHGVADSYDYGYGLVRERTGAFVLSFAPYASTHLPGSGGAVRLVPGEKPLWEEVAFGLRNPLGWCQGPEGEVFATDNQGEWVATSKLVHVAPGRYFGFPNSAQPAHAAKPPGNAAVWVPYGWARSMNGLTFDSTGGKFGPFAGQLFLAELMFGGAIIRVSLEKVNGEYQGACFPFWGKGLLGPLVLAFDPRGRLFVGSITEPGWMAQPDRGALYRIDFTGETPFEIHSIRARPGGFRLVFTLPASPAEARDRGSYSIEHYRYEHTGAYGSPELDRARLEVRAAEVSADGRAVDLQTAPLTAGRVYRISAPGVLSTSSERLVHPTGVYTLNQVPPEGK